MKKLIKISMFALMALLGTSCHDDDAEAEKPSVEVGEVTLSEDEKSATVEVIPSQNAKELHWSVTDEFGDNSYENGVVTNGEPYTIEMQNIELDTNYKLTVYVKNGAGQSTPVVREFRFNKEDILDELVDVDITNVTPITLDVNVTKSIKCSKYVITAMKKYQTVNYDESGNPLSEPTKKELFEVGSFIEQAQRSVDAYQKYAQGESSDYLFAPYVVSTASDEFGEYNLVKAQNLNADFDACRGLAIEAGETYVIAVYAYDAEGEATVYLEDVEIPTEAQVNGIADINIEFLNLSTSYDKVTAKITAGDGCKRIFYGISVPDNWGGDKDMRQMSNSEFEKAVLSLSLGQSHVYNEPVTVELKDNIAPGEERVVWAIAIDANGDIGKIDRAFFTAPQYKATGKGKITGATFANSEDKKSVHITVSADENAKKVRILPYDSMLDWQSATLNYMFYQDAKDAGWKEFEVNNGKVEGDFRFIDGRTQVYYYAATVDADGNVSMGVNIVYQYYSEPSGSWTRYWEIPKADAGEELTFSGNGEITVSVTESKVESTFDGNYIKCDFTVTKGNNTKAVYRFFSSEIKTNGIESYLKEEYPTVDELPTSSLTYKVFDGNSVSFTSTYTDDQVYDSSWGGYIVMFVTVDTNNKYKVAAIYKAGDNGVVTYDLPTQE